MQLCCVIKLLNFVVENKEHGHIFVTVFLIYSVLLPKYPRSVILPRVAAFWGQ